MAKKRSATDLILQVLEKSIDGYVRMEDFMYNTSFYTKGFDRPLKKSNLAQALRRLRLNGYLYVEKLNGEMILRLTDEGKNKIIMQRVLKDEVWDGKWRIVVFDIPEEYKKARDILRSRLKLWEFEQWQKSVWASKKNITEQLRMFIKQVGIGKWVKVIESSNVE